MEFLHRSLVGYYIKELVRVRKISRSSQKALGAKSSSGLKKPESLLELYNAKELVRDRKMS